MEHGDEEPKLDKVVKLMKDNKGNPTGMANKNPILDKIVYDIEFQDGFRQPVAADLIAENLFAQVYQEGRRNKLINMIINIKKNDKYVKDKDSFDISSNGTKRHKANNKSWEVYIHQKDGINTWNTLKDVKDLSTIELAEYPIENRIASKPVFEWWVPYTLKKREPIL